ncbi:MAG: hypothetical protein WC435_02605 [Candidatus Paceibacterota bacterium]
MTEFKFGQFVASAIRVVDVILSGNYPIEQVFDLVSHKRVNFLPPDWNAEKGYFIGRVEADEERGVQSEDSQCLEREIRIWINNGNHKEKNLITIIFRQRYLDGDEFAGWTKWKIEEFHYRDFSSEEKEESWKKISFLREGRVLSHEDWMEMKDSRSWIVVVGC